MFFVVLNFLTFFLIFLLLSDRMRIKTQMLFISYTHSSSILEQFDMSSYDIEIKKTIITGSSGSTQNTSPSWTREDPVLSFLDRIT